MLSVDNCLWLVAALPIVVGLTIMWNGCEGERTILWVGNKIAVHEDCCCCPQCTGCLKTPWVWGTVEFTGIKGIDYASSPPPIFSDCSDETNEEDYCRYGDGGPSAPNGLNDTTFEVECLAAAACEYNASSGTGQFCGFDSIDVSLYYLLSSNRGVFVRIRDNETPSWYAWAYFFEQKSYPIDCSEEQTPALSDESGNTCDFSSATVTFTPLCEEPA